MTPENENQKSTQPASALPEAPNSLRAKRVIVLTLKSKQTEHNNVTFRLNKDRIVLGSVISADVRLTGDGVAPIHAVLEVTEDGPAIYDLASDTGVFVNGSKVVTQALKSGDSLTIGHNNLSFELETVERTISRAHGGVRIWEAEGKKLFLSSDEELGALLLEDEKEVRPIFDYRPTSKSALEVVMAWSGIILDVEHFVNEKAVTIGQERKADFGIPPLLSAKSYAFVSRVGESFVLNLDTATMKGVMQRKGALRTLEDIRSSTVRGATGGYQIPLEKDDFAKISVGDVDFYLSFTAAPPRLKRPSLFANDPFFMKIFIPSMLLTAAGIAGLMSIQVPPGIEAEQVPERIATILYQPEKFPARPKPKVVPRPKETAPPVNTAVTPPPVKTPPKPPTPKETVKVEIQPKPVDTSKPIPKEMVVAKQPQKRPQVAVNKGGGPAKGQNEAKEGEGARAKGQEGSRGDRNAAPGKTPQTVANRPSPEAGTGKGGGNSQVQEEGNIDILKGAGGKITDLLGNAGERLGKGGEKLKGFGGFSTRGNGGLALSGSGTGGGGTADSLGGLGNKGTGGGRVGTGKGAAGSGTGIIGGQARVAIRSGGPEETVILGSIDPDIIERVLAAHRDEFRVCYEREIQGDAKLAGSVLTHFTIGPSGAVTQSGIASASGGLDKSKVPACVAGVIKRIVFPVPQGAGVIDVRYPFKFNPVGT